MLSLDPLKIEETIQRLEQRISERFPGSGLSRVCHELRQIGTLARERAREMQQPNLGLRLLIGFFVIAILAGAVGTLVRIGMPIRVDDFAELVQAVESGIQDVVFVGLAIFFLITIESRLKRRRALAAMHELRVIAHLIDMHQLTKDPEQLLSGATTASSPQRLMSSFELGRYLDYCSEMLALIGKLAAVYVQHFDDAVVLEAANEIEDLTTGLSQKIWQKITLIQRMAD